MVVVALGEPGTPVVSTARAGRVASMRSAAPTAAVRALLMLDLVNRLFMLLPPWFDVRSCLVR